MPEAAERPEDIDRSFRIVLAQEEKFALFLGRAVLDRPELSVWMILIPILLIHHVHRMRRYRDGILAFAERFLSTRKQALEASREEVKEGLRREVKEGLADGDGRESQVSEEREYSTAPLEVPEAPSLQDAHAAEMELLKGHYRLLLRQTGATYPELITKGYSSAAAYRSFLQRLARAEADVHEAVLASRPEDEGAREVVAKMQEAAARFREVEVRLIFG